MALTQVRVKLGEEWATLTYNEATGRYEGTVTPPGTSYHQPEGYFSLTAEATNGAGETVSISGEQLPALRLVVRETAAPTLTIVSPAPGYLQTGTPIFTFDAVDEEGGSGVDPETFGVVVGPGGPTNQAETYGDDPPRAAGPTWEPIPNGYRFTWTPPEGWVDGSHTVTASVSDHDGNRTAVSGAYIVDTVPPVLLLRQPDRRHVVDDESVTVVVEAWDDTAGVASVTIGGLSVGPVPLGGPADRSGVEKMTRRGRRVPQAAGPTGVYTATVPLAIGENHIPIVVTDGAGNQTTAEVYMIRLVTDRTKADVDKLVDLYSRGMDNWTAEELEWFNMVSCLRGSYDAEDRNRVGAAVQWLAGELKRRGFVANVQPKTDWTQEDAPTLTLMATYLRNVETVRTALGLYVEAQPPVTMRKSGIDGWNAIEKALVETDAWFPYYSAWSSGEITCGGV